MYRKKVLISSIEKFGRDNITDLILAIMIPLSLVSECKQNYNKLQEIMKELGALIETIKYVSLKYQRQCLVRDSSDPQANSLDSLIINS